ncbi:MAG: TldD/PmbA family protein [candidate division KSB1 bacterium]|nr:TldD/PmbA family protein [candidate division KSB1 bacterium]
MTSFSEEKLARQVVELGLRLGAEDVEVQLAVATEFEVEVRQGKIERLVQAASRSLGVRVTKGHRVALAATTDLDEATLQHLIRNAVERAEVAGEDPYAGPPEEFGAPVEPASLDLYDPELEVLAPEAKIAAATETERIALALDPRISNSLGAWMSTVTTSFWFANSRGVERSFRSTHASLGVGLQAGDTDHRVEEYWWSSARHLQDLESPETVAEKAVARTVRELNPRKPITTRADVIFEPRMTAQLLSFLAACVNGMLIYRGRSFLAGKLGETVFGPNISVIDDALLPRGLGSRPCDSEGVATSRTVVIENGVLKSYLLNTYAARRLGLRTTGHASGQGVSPHNFYLAGEGIPPEEIVRSTERGLLLTRTIGHGTNTVTGEISKGAYGIWIEGGNLAYPVSEFTISGDLASWLRSVDAIGNDLEFRSPIGGRTIRVRDVVIAGR